jgi:hypothetical protein
VRSSTPPPPSQCPSSTSGLTSKVVVARRRPSHPQSCCHSSCSSFFGCDHHWHPDHAWGCLCGLGGWGCPLFARVPQLIPGSSSWPRRSPCVPCAPCGHNPFLRANHSYWHPPSISTPFSPLWYPWDDLGCPILRCVVPLWVGWGWVFGAGEGLA